MRTGGTGGDRTRTGLFFEQRTKLSDAITQVPGLAVDGNIVRRDKEPVAEIYEKHGFYKDFLEPRGVDYRKLISKQLLPDQALYVRDRSRMHILEMKWQQVDGSVDEKLQTCAFKLSQYQKLLTPIGVETRFSYVLNDWFRNDRYRDVLEYVHSAGCFYYFNTIPATDLDLLP